MRASVLVAAGGVVGTILRWGIEEAFPFDPGSAFPWATLAVNVSGAFFLGILGVLLIERLTAGARWRPFWTIGLVGSYTTFSTMAVEGVLLLEAGRLVAAGGYWVGTLVLGQVAGVYGMWLGRIERSGRRAT
jgi:fluoride exporter